MHGGERAAQVEADERRLAGAERARAPSSSSSVAPSMNSIQTARRALELVGGVHGDDVGVADAREQATLRAARARQSAGSPSGSRSSSS